jgi:hypothetical protein
MYSYAHLLQLGNELMKELFEQEKKSRSFAFCRSDFNQVCTCFLFTVSVCHCQSHLFVTERDFSPLYIQLVLVAMIRHENAEASTLPL